MYTSRGEKRDGIYGFRAEREDALELIAARVDAVANAVCERHYDAPTQEHQMSAKLAEAIEKEIGGLKTRPFTVGVAVQDFPDKGRNSWERPTGADLYMSIVRIEDEVTSKGMLVQSKWDRTFSHHRTDVRQQCERMLARSESSYVWVFGPHQVVSIHAEDALSRERSPWSDGRPADRQWLALQSGRLADRAGHF